MQRNAPSSSITARLAWALRNIWPRPISNNSLERNLSRPLQEYASYTPDFISGRFQSDFNSCRTLWPDKEW